MISALFKKSVSILFFLFLLILLTFRLLSDHSQNYHYTGNYPDDAAVMLAADNFRKIGFGTSRGIPIYKEIEEGTTETLESLKPYLYLSTPPLPHWVFGAIYLQFGQSEIAARILALLISLLGLYCAIKIVQEFQLLAESHPPGQLFLIVALLAINPVFLLFTDVIQGQSLLMALAWVFFYWSIRYLFYQASLWWGIFLYFLHVWTGFEWLFPLLLLSCYCIYKRVGPPTQNLKPWVLFILLGFGLPLFLRLLLNASVLGGLEEAMSYFITRAKLRSLGDPSFSHLQYSFIKHIGKIVFGLLWFVGLPTILLATFSLPKVWGASSKNRTLFHLLFIWGLGSLSWQVLMPQNAMIHAFTQIYFANFLFLLAAIGLVLFWSESKTFMLPLLLLHCLHTGFVAKSEVILPFLAHSTQVLAKSICPHDREQLLQTLAPIRSSISYAIQRKMTHRGETACGPVSRWASGILKLYAYVIKSRLEGETIPFKSP